MRAPDRSYPAAAENFWLARTEADSGVGRDELDRMAPHVAALSDLFTTERPEGDYPVYFSDPDALNAYGLFFLPQGWMRTSAALAQCMDFRGWRPASADPRVLDVGCGPGSCGVAAARVLADRGCAPSLLVGLDHAPSALGAFESFAAAILGEVTAVRTRISDVRSPENWPDDKYDLIVAGFVLNELRAGDHRAVSAWMRQAGGKLREGGLLLVIEPAPRFAAERLSRASDELAAEGDLTRIGPQLDALPSPILAAARDHWEYETSDWAVPGSAEFINRRLHRDLREVRFSYAAFMRGRPPVAPPPDAARVTSDVQTIKGLVRFMVTQSGAERQVEVATRGLSKHDIKAYAAGIRRGSVVRFQGPEGPKVRLDGPSAVEVLWTP
ncbi:MAG: methyltransferase domain-containing protein [Opitutia bacterium]